MFLVCAKSSEIKTPYEDGNENLAHGAEINRVYVQSNKAFFSFIDDAPKFGIKVLRAFGTKHSSEMQYSYGHPRGLCRDRSLVLLEIINPNILSSFISNLRSVRELPNRPKGDIADEISFTFPSDVMEPTNPEHQVEVINFMQSYDMTLRDLEHFEQKYEDAFPVGQILDHLKKIITNNDKDLDSDFMPLLADERMKFACFSTLANSEKSFVMNLMYLWDFDQIKPINKWDEFGQQYHLNVSHPSCKDLQEKFNYIYCKQEAPNIDEEDCLDHLVYARAKEFIPSLSAEQFQSNSSKVIAECLFSYLEQYIKRLNSSNDDFNSKNAFLYPTLESSYQTFVKNKPAGFFRELGIPYEGLTDDEKGSW